jgi:hypothetical protein
MEDNRKKVLEMLANKQISVDEAERLLALVDKPETSRGEKKESPKYLRVSIKPGEGGEDVDRVNVRVPMALIRAGVKFSSLIPGDAADKIDAAVREKGINFSLKNLKEEDIEQLVVALSDLEVDIEGGKGKLNVYAE